MPSSVSCGRRRRSLDAPAVEYDDAVGECRRLILVMRDEQRSGAERIMDAAQLRSQPVADLAVQRAERLVQQQDTRLHRKRASERHPLPLPAGQLRRDVGARMTG